MADSCEHGEEPSGPIEDGEVFDQVTDYQLIKKDCVP
jgi:hypothetical protein